MVLALIIGVLKDCFLHFKSTELCQYPDSAQIRFCIWVLVYRQRESIDQIDIPFEIRDSNVFYL